MKSKWYDIVNHKNQWNFYTINTQQWLDWIVQCFTSPPTQYRLYGRRFLQVKRPNQQYQSTEGTNSTHTNQTYNKQTWTQNTASPLVYSNIGWLGDGSHRGQGCHAWTEVGLLSRYPRVFTEVWLTGMNSYWYLSDWEMLHLRCNVTATTQICVVRKPREICS